jgi:N-acetyl-beta-hexosaminidase
MSIPRRRFLTISGAAVVTDLAQATATGAAASADARAAASPPQTIPNLQSWTAATGQYSLPATVRILLSSAHSSTLRTTADVLAEDLRTVTRRTVTVVEQATPAPAAGDIVLTLAPVTGLNEEGYELQVGSSMQVRGTKAGVFYGTRTILQWLRQATVVPAGLARDWPRYPDRGLLVSNAAKYYTLTWWKGQIQEMAYLKLNLLWISVGYDTSPLAEMKEVAAYAARYNISVIPLTNLPGHVEKHLGSRPDLALPGRTWTTSRRRTGISARTSTSPSSAATSQSGTTCSRNCWRRPGSASGRPRSRRTCCTGSSTT